MKLKILDLILLILCFLIYGSMSVYLQNKEQSEIKNFNIKYSENYLNFEMNSLLCTKLYTYDKKCLENTNGNVKIF